MKNPILIPFYFGLLVLSFISCSKDDPIEDIKTSSDLRSVLEDIHDDSEAPGFAVSVIKNDELLFQEAFGKANIDNDIAYTNQTTQAIGSISKTFVGAAVVKAIEGGYFDLETDINDILPFEVKNPNQPNAVIKVRHLVTHTSGLLDDFNTYIQAYHILPGEDLSAEGSELLIDLFEIEQRETVNLGDFLSEYYLETGEFYNEDNYLDGTPGTIWNYSNIASSLTAYLVESATGIPFKEYVSSNILEPLGMTHSAYDLSALDSENIARLYWDKNTPLPNYANDSYPDGSINTSNEDLAKYLKDMMKGVRGLTNTLFSETGYEMLFSPLLTEGLMHPAVGDNQGIFWVLEDGEIKHDGSDPGTTCNMLFNETGTAGYLLLTNMDASTDEHETEYFDLAVEVHNAILEFIENN